MGVLTIEGLTQPVAAVPRCCQTMRFEGSVLIAMMIVPGRRGTFGAVDRIAAKERKRALGAVTLYLLLTSCVCHEAHFRCGMIWRYHCHGVVACPITVGQLSASLMCGHFLPKSGSGKGKCGVSHGNAFWPWLVRNRNEGEATSKGPFSSPNSAN